MKSFKITSYILIILLFSSNAIAGGKGGKQKPPLRANVEMSQPAPTGIFSWFNLDIFK